MTDLSDHLVRIIDALSVRVATLESSICRCGNCVMHRDKARHGKVGLFAQLAPEQQQAVRDGSMDLPALELPAWQRAKVGDRVGHRYHGVCVVSAVDDGAAACSTDRRLQATTGVWMRNQEVLSILPPEPAAPSPEPLCSHLQHILSEPSAPAQVTRDKLLDLLADFERSPDGTHYGDLIDKHFPGLDVVEG